ncbi:MAG: 3-oxoacyl-(acyl-carrier-protein) reductase FabG [Lentisphaerae bacterium ADurb.Bin242]|nr:MAG: 3-oxoacyl-(acyl-carrier-protein) reductase FabG [Lentisphaerae bacterium ADurb.Bin242]
MEEIKGKAALVTGGSQGIGRVIALSLADKGCRVVVNCANNPDNAQRVADEIIAKGGRAEVCRCDVSDEKAVEAMFDALGRIDILVNNARLDPWRRTAEMSEGEWWSRVMDVNLKGAFLCSMAFFNRAKNYGWGRIVNVASVRSFIPAEMTMIAYGVSKLGMHGITRAMAHNGAPFGITANTVCPGMVITENINKRLTPEKYKKEQDAIPLGRPAASEEIADAVLFVIGNGYVTGETININGGMYYAP